MKFRLCTLIFSLANFHLIINHQEWGYLIFLPGKKKSLALKTIRGSGVSDFKLPALLSPVEGRNEERAGKTNSPFISGVKNAPTDTAHFSYRTDVF